MDHNDVAALEQLRLELGTPHVAQYRLGRTPREAALCSDIKQLIRELLLAEARDEIYEYVRELDAEEGVIPTVEDLLDRIRRSDDAA